MAQASQMLAWASWGLEKSIKRLLGCVTQFITSLRLRLITRGGVAYAQQGDLDTCCLVFLSESFMWTRLGYFMINCTTFHFKVESGTCIILSIIDLNYGKVDDQFVKCMLNRGLLRMIVVIVIVFLLIIVFWCLLIFYNKLTFAIFVPCDWCL